MRFTYAVITAARDEQEALPLLADSLVRQVLPPVRWVIVENGSKDQTLDVARRLSEAHPWIDPIVAFESGSRERGAPIVRALEAGVARLGALPEIVVNVDADVTMEPEYFDRLVSAFEADPGLGIASGSAWEFADGHWHQRFVTGGTVWGATRAYRRECLRDVWPLEHRHGWDGIDQLKARSRGWHTAVLADLPFRHHRPEGSRDGSAWAHWVVNGATAHFMRYRPTYLILRTLHHARKDTAAVGLIYGYAREAARRSPQLDDLDAAAVIRNDQRLRSLLTRKREADGSQAQN